VADESSNGENVIAVNFAEDAKAYQALTRLKELASQGQVRLTGAAVVVRDEDGQIEVKDHVSGGTGSHTLTGGLIGLLIGILAGPFGILLGGATGLLLGSLFDSQDVDETESALSDISRSVTVGRTALLAEVIEQSTEVVDTAMDELGGDVLRRSIGDVQAEIAAAEEAQKQAKRQARESLRKAHHEQHQQDFQAKIDALKAKFHRTKSGADTAS
jgi:uncharacterized membrane protein